jgi:hypothetical protein
MLDPGILALIMAVISKQLVNNPGHLVWEAAGAPQDVMYNNPPCRDLYSGRAVQLLDPFIILTQDLGVGSAAKHKLEIPGF